jgi:uncharacterized membrane protein YbhN (UPF0104 family)
VVILAAVFWRLGTGPLLRGLRSVDEGTVAIAVTVTALTTVCCAWRWRIVARGLGMRLRLRVAVAAYYRSQFLNTVLPGGLLGDVHRGVDHGRPTNEVGRGLRAVAWERVAGQVVQVLVSIAVLAALPSPARSILPIVVAGAAVLTVLVAAAAWLLPTNGPSRRARFRRLIGYEFRRGIGRAWPAVAAASVAAQAGHVVVFVVAARAVGSHASIAVLVPLAVLVLLAAALPINVGGWGPREGVAAWAFAAAGLGADRGVAAATAFGVFVFIASLPGAVVLVVAAARRRHVPAPPPAAERRLVGALDG